MNDGPQSYLIYLQYKRDLTSYISPQSNRGFFNLVYWLFFLRDISLVPTSSHYTNIKSLLPLWAQGICQVLVESQRYGFDLEDPKLTE